MESKQTEHIYPTEFFYRYAIVPGHVPMPAIRTKKVDLGQPCFICGRRDFEEAVDKAESIKSNFTDFESTKNTGKYVCLYCAATVSDAARRVGRYCVTRTGMETKGFDIGAIIASPPEPPFLLGIGDFQKHTVYKGRVTVSKNLIYVIVLPQKGRHNVIPNKDWLVEIDREEAIGAAETISHLATALKAKPIGVVAGNISSKRIEELNNEDRRLYTEFHAVHGPWSDTAWAAIKIIKTGEK